jgi:hypothetical protein
MPPAFGAAAAPSSRSGSPAAELAGAPDQASLWELGRDMLAEPMALGMAEGERPAGLGPVEPGSMQEAGRSPMLGSEAMLPEEARRSGTGSSAQHAQAAPGQPWDVFRAPELDAAQPMEPGEPGPPWLAEGEARFTSHASLHCMWCIMCWFEQGPCGLMVAQARPQTGFSRKLPPWQCQTRLPHCRAASASQGPAPTLTCRRSCMPAWALPCQVQLQSGCRPRRRWICLLCPCMAALASQAPAPSAASASRVRPPVPSLSAAQTPG